MSLSFGQQGMRAFTSVLVIGAFLGSGWLAGLALRSVRGVRTLPVAWPADAPAGLDLAPPATGGSAGPLPVLDIFGDYECGACLSLHVRLGARLIELTKAGRLRVFYHMAPLAPHWRGELAGEIAYCVPAPRRASAHARIFEAVARWTVAEDPEAAILGEVTAGAEDGAAIRQCLASGAGRIAVERDRALASALGIHAVPGIFLNGERLEFDSWQSLGRFVERAASP
jgi:protein-disulfide isomerase